jgi:hypothetical protein
MLVIIRLEYVTLFCKTLTTRYMERHFLLLETEYLFGCKQLSKLGCQTLHD